MKLSLFKYIDTFGKVPQLRIAGYSKRSTYLGAIITTIIIMIVLGMIGYLLNIIFSKLNPIISYSQKTVQHPQPIYFSSENFSVVVGLETPTYSQFINESIYSVKAKVFVANNGDFSVNYLDVQRCSQEKIPEYSRSQFSVLGIENMYCLSNGSFKIYGTWVDPINSYLEFEFKQCFNTSMNNNSCATQEVINSYLNSTYVSIYFVDSSIDPTNFTNPIQNFVGQPFTAVSLYSFQQISTYFKTNTILTDNGLIFEDFSEKKVISADYNLNFFSLSKPIDNAFFKYNLRLSSAEATYRRSFMKIQTAFALIGGIKNFFDYCGLILLYFYSELKFNETLMNKISI